MTQQNDKNKEKKQSLPIKKNRDPHSNITSIDDA
jgi:hypothetical protein